MFLVVTFWTCWTTGLSVHTNGISSPERKPRRQYVSQIWNQQNLRTSESVRTCCGVFFHFPRWWREIGFSESNPNLRTYTVFTLSSLQKNYLRILEFPQRRRPQSYRWWRQLPRLYQSKLRCSCTWLLFVSTVHLRAGRWVTCHSRCSKQTEQFSPDSQPFVIYSTWISILNNFIQLLIICYK